MSVPLPDHLSASGWKQWEQCPARWRAKYVDHRDDQVGPAAEIGTFGHKVYEHLMNRARPYRTIEAARHHARWLRVAPDGLWGEEALPPSVRRGEISDADFRRAAWYGIQGLWALEDPTEVDVVATEQRIEWTEGDVPMVAIVDRIDRNGRESLYPGLSIVDYKFGNFKPKYQAQPKRQIVIGAMAVASQEGPLAVAHAGSVLYVSDDRVVTAETTREARRRVSEEAQGVWADIGRACATETFPATTGVLCNWCPLVGECREGQSYLRASRANGWRSFYPDSPGAKVLAALDAA